MKNGDLEQLIKLWTEFQKWHDEKYRPPGTVTNNGLLAISSHTHLTTDIGEFLDWVSIQFKAILTTDGNSQRPRDNESQADI